MRATPEELTEARAAAQAMRGEWLAAVREGFTTPAEVIAKAADPGFEPLRAIRLTSLLTAQQGCGEVSAGRIVRILLAVVGVDMKPNRVTVSWLIDRRACGRRLVAFANVVLKDSGPPWEGFPSTPRKK